MSTDSAHNALIGPDTPGAKVIRRLSIYFKSGEGHTFELEPDDQLIDPLLRPEGASEEWEPDPMDVRFPKLIIHRQCANPNDMNRESISLEAVAWTRYQEIWTAPKPQPSTNLIPARPQAPRFRDDRRPSTGPTRASASSKDPVKLPPEG
jgi:hypothetical protein